MQAFIKMTTFYQKKLFLRWARRNRRLFSHQPYLLRQKERYFVIGFRGISRRIQCFFIRAGGIEIQVAYQNEFFDIVTEFDLYEEQTPEGRWLCRMCRDYPDQDRNESCIEYEDRETLWIKHSFEPLAAWTRENFRPDAKLCVCRFRGCMSAIVARGERLQRTVRRRDFFRKLPVLTARKRR